MGGTSGTLVAKSSESMGARAGRRRQRRLHLSVNLCIHHLRVSHRWRSRSKKRRARVPMMTLGHDCCSMAQTCRAPGATPLLFASQSHAAVRTSPRRRPASSTPAALGATLTSSSTLALSAAFSRISSITSAMLRTP